MTDLDILSEIRERVVRVETKIDLMTDVKDTAEEAKETANEALQSTKSAHHRIDEISKNQTWLWRTVIGALLTSAIGLLFFYFQKVG
ncbi:hemolysin XhlA family protein [Tepidibacillus decaturensis]|uniref:Hemolysin XhlA n=1 Tax=Tepidibacillus decaturensis TaxID=1413211 RepID=A0A135L1M3_9BACI|nr:hemolysin XhlA family protein [Tepidibacillus decaturensis]KXG42885.1 hemolysin XhlA [Tepidibacillus decaturensis]